MDRDARSKIHPGVGVRARSRDPQTQNSFADCSFAKRSESLRYCTFRQGSYFSTLSLRLFRANFARQAMSNRPRMTPQERIRAAQELRRRAIDQPGLSQRQRQNARRVAHNLVMLNSLQASQRSDPHRVTPGPQPSNDESSGAYQPTVDQSSSESHQSKSG